MAIEFAVDDQKEEPMADFDVDICATILADKPPQLPLREELNSLGFEVIFNAAGTGAKAVKHDSKRNVEKFRKTTQIKDLRKRRFFPKSSKRIKAKLAERKKLESDLALPHACSYQSYGKELGHDTDYSTSEDSSYLSFDESRAQKRWGMFKRRQTQQLQTTPTSVKSDSEFHKAAADAVVFPDFLAPFDVPENKLRPAPSIRPEPDLRDRWKEAFAALDALNDEEESKRPDKLHKASKLQTNEASPQPACSNVASLVFQATHLDDESRKEVQGIAHWLSTEEKDITAVNSGASATTGVFDGIDTDGENTCAAEDKAAGVLRNDLNESSKQNVGTASIPTSNNAFDNVPLDFYTNVGSDTAEEQGSKKPQESRQDINFDESFAVKLSNAKIPTKTSRTQGAFEDVPSKFYQTSGMGSPESSVSMKVIGVSKKQSGSGGIGLTSAKAEPAEATDNLAADFKRKEKIEEHSIESKPKNAFDRATAEICKAVGIEKPGTNHNRQDEDRTQDGPLEWMASAKHVFDNFSSEIFKVTGFDQHAKDTTPNSVEAHALEDMIKSGDISILLKLISQVGTPSHAIEGVIRTSPELLQVRHQQDGRLPLHVMCDRRMPDRASASDSNLTDFLLKDIASYKRLVKTAVNLYSEACLKQDKRFDLPVHLVARNLMEWEATWYESVYQKAANEKGTSTTTAIAITKLYQTMSETVELLMTPLFSDLSLSTSLCRAPGSMGTILPLHIATIFTVSVKTLRLVLEAYPEAATIQCDLGILQTFIPDECIPLELHDNLSTDFPKWEVESKENSASERNELEENSEDCMRRSDLLFAYNQIEPHRFQKARIRRIESRIQFDATMVLGKSSGRMNRANELLWVWMCTFREPDTNRPTYVNSVKRIVSTLSFQSIRYLVSVETKQGHMIVDAANPECLRVIQRRLEHITDQSHVISSPSSTDNLAQEMMEHSYKKHIVGHICRLVFNVPATQYPTSFVVLPYKLSRNDEGVFGLASPNFSRVATKFAECLLTMTDPRTILHMLDTKSTKHYDQSLYDSTADDAFYLETIARIDGYEESLLALYESGNGYLYLIDETTGLPQVTPSDPVYPIVLRDPSNFVRSTLPLMMMGMVQMRGEKAIPKLINVLLDHRVAAVLPGWGDAASELATYLEAQGDGGSLQNTGLIQTKHSLYAFQSSCPSKQRLSTNPIKGLTEWDAELWSLEMLLDTNDPDRQYSGLPVPMTTTLSLKADNGKETSHVQNKVAVKPLVYESPAVDELSRKMDELGRLQRATTGRQHQALPEILSESKSYSFDDDVVLIGNTFSAAEEKIDTDIPIIDLIDDPKGRKHMVSKYSLLFDDLAMDEPEDYDEARDAAESDVRVWNASERVWEDVTSQLNTRAGTFCEDTQILQLKVALAEQAKKLAQLGKKVSSLKDEEQRLFSHEDEIREAERDQETHASDFASRDSLSSARKLVHRMCDLEERLVCDEIKIQHLAIEAYQLEHEGEDITTCFGERKSSRFRPENTSFLTLPGDRESLQTNKVTVSQIPDELRGRGIGDNRSSLQYSAFQKQEIGSSKAVRFDDAPLRRNNETERRSERCSACNESSSTDSVQFLMSVGGESRQDTTSGRIQSAALDKSTTPTKSAFSSGRHVEKKQPIRTIPIINAERMYDHRETISTQATMSNMPFGSASGKKTPSPEPPTKVVRFSPTPNETPKQFSTDLPIYSELDTDKSKFSSDNVQGRRSVPQQKDLPKTCCGGVEDFWGLEGGEDKAKKSNMSRIFEVDQRLPMQGRSSVSMVRLTPQSHDKKNEAKFGRVTPGRAEESVSEVTDTATSTESVFRRSRPTRTITLNTPLPTRDLSGLSDKTGESDFSSSQKEVAIDNLISRYTTEANARIASSAAWMHVHGPVIND